MNEQEQREVWESLSLVDLAKELQARTNAKDALKEQSAAIQKEIDILSIGIIPEKMADEEISTMKIDGVGRLQTRSDAWVSVLAANKPAFLEWCLANNQGPLIKSDIHAQTLKAFIKDRVKQGKEYPQHLVKFEAYEKAIVVKLSDAEARKNGV